MSCWLSRPKNQQFHKLLENSSACWSLKTTVSLKSCSQRTSDPKDVTNRYKTAEQVACCGSLSSVLGSKEMHPERIWSSRPHCAHHAEVCWVGESVNFAARILWGRRLHDRSTRLWKFVQREHTCWDILARRWPLWVVNGINSQTQHTWSPADFP